MLPSPNPSHTQLPARVSSYWRRADIRNSRQNRSKRNGWRKKPSHAYMEVAHSHVKPLFIFFFPFKSFLCTSLKSRYHKSSYFESFKIRNSVDDQLFRDYLGYYLDDF